MSALLPISRLIDALTERIGRFMMYLVLLTTLISAGNAIVRKVFQVGSNAWLEIQWYLFAAVFMLGLGYAFLKNVHVRIDFVSNRFSARTRNLIDIAGILIFVFPLCWMMVDLSWPLFHNAWVSGETSSNAGGLIRWPVYALIPAGFVLLAIQSFSELIKRLAFLTGAGRDPLGHEGPSEEEELLKALQEEQAAAATANGTAAKVN